MMNQAAMVDVRRSALDVMKQALHVSIDQDRARELALQFEPVLAPAFSPAPNGLNTHDRALVHLMHAAVRFGSGWESGLRRRDGLDGASTVAAGLREQVERHGPPTARLLSRIKASDCARIFGQDPADPRCAELMELHARALRDLGRHLEAHHGGDALRFLACAGGSLQGLYDTCSGMPFFCDVQRYRGIEVQFFLRAQQLASGLAAEFGGKGPGRFEDMDDSCLSSDPVAIGALVAAGVLKPEQGILTRLSAGESIPAHSEREIELRAAAIVAVELFVHAARRAGREASSLGVDSWLRSRSDWLHAPVPRVRTVSY